MTGPGDEMAAGTAGRGRLRASRADREQVIDTIKAAFVQDRLTKDEFDLRVGQALASRTYADLAALTADIPAGLTGAQLPGKPTRARARPPANTDVKRVACLITAITMLTAGLWAAVLSANVDNGALGGLVFIFTFVWLGIVILAGMVMLESRHQTRPGGQLPPRPASSAGGQASRRPASGGPAGQPPQIDHGQQHTAEAARSRLPRLPLSSSRSRWRPRGRHYAIGYAGH